MFSLSIAFGGGTATIWALLYKTEEKANDHFNFLKSQIIPGEFIQLQDDFGQSFCISRANIVAVMFEDLEQSKLGQIERGLHQARTHAKGQQMASADPTLRTAAMTAGPSVLNGNFGRQ